MCWLSPSGRTSAIAVCACLHSPRQETQEEPCISQSPPWRRTPSYEQLQQISLLSSEADSRLSPGLPPEGGLIHRRALTLSMAGSEGLGDDTSYGGFGYGGKGWGLIPLRRWSLVLPSSHSRSLCLPLHTGV